MANEIITISPSLIGYLSECPRCLWLHFNESKKRPRGVFPSLPDGMDNILKMYFDGYRNAGTLPPELEGRVDAKLFSERSRLDTWRDINFGRGGLSADIPEYRMRLRGAIDDLLISGDGKYIPLDFKTRGYPTKEDTHEHYRTQLDCYGLLFERNGLPPAGIGYLLFFWPEKYDQLRTSFKTDLVEMDVKPERALELLGNVRRILDGPIPPAHEACEYCLYLGS